MIARWSLAVLGVVVLGTPVRAAPITSPVNRITVDTTSGGWTVHRAIGDKNVDLLRSQEHRNVAIGIVETDCATFFTQQDAALGTTFAQDVKFTVPAGWDVRSARVGSGTGKNLTYLGCHRGATLTVAVQWWPVKSDDSGPEVTDLLTALDKARINGGISARDDLVWLAGLPAIQVPESMRVSVIERGSTAARSDHDGLAVFTLAGGEKVQFRKGQACTNLNAYMEGWNGGEVTTPRTDRWKKWTNGKVDGFCIDRLAGEGVWLVLGPADDPSVAMLLASIEGELFDPFLQDVKALPATGWPMPIPRDARARDVGGGADHVTGPGFDLTVRRSPSCAATEPSGSRERYEPGWLAGWSGVIDQSTGIVTLCLLSPKRGALEISMPAGLLTGGTRRTIGDVLGRTMYMVENAYEPPRAKTLSFPIEIGLQTTKGGERGFGPRAGAQLTTRNGWARLRAEVGWDTGSGLAYDVSVTAGVMFSRLGVSVTAGADAVGSGDKRIIAAAPYGGVILRLGAADDRGRGWGSLNLALLRRYQPEAEPGSMLDEDLHPKAELRIGFDVFRRAGSINALKIEYQTYGDRNLFQLMLGKTF